MIPKVFLLLHAGALCTTRSLALLSGQPVRSPSTRRIFFHQAIIYAADDNDKNRRLEDESPPPYSKSRENQDLLDFISRDSMDALARLAVVFSPADRRLKLRDIEHVEILRVDESHIEIQAVLCEDDGCVTLAVPVSFPYPCGMVTETCVMDNLNALDAQANTHLRQIQWEDDHHEEIEAFKRQRKVLEATNNIALPDWWIKPSQKDLVDECEFLRELLNEEEFATEVTNIAAYAMKSSSASTRVVEQAAVAAIGLTGMILRASYKGTDTAIKIVELPFRFAKPADDKEMLRAAVLGAASLPVVEGNDIPVIQNDNKNTTAKSSEDVEDDDEEDDDLGIELPPWWVAPRGKFKKECKELLKVLQDGTFDGIMNRLASKALGEILQDDQQCVDWAKVVAVGPAGFILQTTFREDAILGGAQESSSMYLPQHFGFVAEDISILQAELWGMLSFQNDDPMQDDSHFGYNAPHEQTGRSLQNVPNSNRDERKGTGNYLYNKGGSSQYSDPVWGRLPQHSDNLRQTDTYQNNGHDFPPRHESNTGGSLYSHNNDIRQDASSNHRGNDKFAQQSGSQWGMMPFQTNYIRQDSVSSSRNNIPVTQVAPSWGTVPSQSISMEHDATRYQFRNDLSTQPATSGPSSFQNVNVQRDTIYSHDGNNGRYSYSPIAATSASGRSSFQNDYVQRDTLYSHDGSDGRYAYSPRAATSAFGPSSFQNDYVQRDTLYSHEDSDGRYAYSPRVATSAFGPSSFQNDFVKRDLLNNHVGSNSGYASGSNGGYAYSPRAATSALGPSSFQNGYVQRDTPYSHEDSDDRYAYSTRVAASAFGPSSFQNDYVKRDILNNHVGSNSGYASGSNGGYAYSPRAATSAFGPSSFRNGYAQSDTLDSHDCSSGQHDAYSAKGAPIWGPSPFQADNSGQIATSNYYGSYVSALQAALTVEPLPLPSNSMAYDAISNQYGHDISTLHAAPFWGPTPLQRDFVDDYRVVEKITPPRVSAAGSSLSLQDGQQQNRPSMGISSSGGSSSVRDLDEDRVPPILRDIPTLNYPTAHGASPVNNNRQAIDGNYGKESIQYPSWWLYPGHTLEEECNRLRNIFNEDEFASDVVKLAIEKASETRKEQVRVDVARVAMVGPAGMILRASEEVNPGHFHDYDIPVQFSQVSHDGASLRASIVGALTSNPLLITPETSHTSWY